jgi:protein required for attachment to host cells
MKITGSVAEQGFKAIPRSKDVYRGKPVPLIWVVLANSRKALVYQQHKNRLDLIAEAEPDEESIPTEAQKTTGHINASQGSVYYTSDPMDRENHHDDKAFIKSLSEWLKKADQQDAFDKLILAAAPRTLGDLRDSLCAAVAGKIVAELNKDLINMPKDEFERYLASQTGTH